MVTYGLSSSILRNGSFGRGRALALNRGSARLAADSRAITESFQTAKRGGTDPEPGKRPALAAEVGRDAFTLASTMAADFAEMSDLGQPHRGAAAAAGVTQDGAMDQTSEVFGKCRS